MTGKTLIIGAGGQIGIELALELRNKRGNENVVASDINDSKKDLLGEGPFEVLDVLDMAALAEVITRHQIGEVYLLAALLSATAEKNPAFGWRLNMQGLFNALELAREKKFSRLFWPSSIAVFGPTTPRQHTPQHTIMEPTSVYGISKLAGEQWCNYYHEKFGVDVRCIRYPGLIGYRSEPGGGTTDYAVEIFYHALERGSYECFLGPHTRLPMMMMQDAIRATTEIMQAPAEKIKLRTGYNLAGMSFTPQELAQEITRHIPEFSISYNPDFRQALADSWPESIDDTSAQQDWNWSPQFDTPRLVDAMLQGIRQKISNTTSASTAH